MWHEYEKQVDAITQNGIIANNMILEQEEAKKKRQRDYCVDMEDLIKPNQYNCRLTDPFWR